MSRCYECADIEGACTCGRTTRQVVAREVREYARDTHAEHDKNTACLRCDITAVLLHVADRIERTP